MIGLDSQVEPIVPMGLITEVLGCEVTWKGKEVKVRHPRRGDLKVTQVNGCPQIPRQEALELIRELEDLRSGIGSKATEFSQEFNWMKKLVEEHPLLSKLPSWLKKGLAVEPGQRADLPAKKGGGRG